MTYTEIIGCKINFTLSQQCDDSTLDFSPILLLANHNDNNYYYAIYLARWRMNMEVISHVIISTCLTCKQHLRSIWVKTSYCSRLTVPVIRCWNVDLFPLSLLLLTLDQVSKTTVIQSNTGTILSYCDGHCLFFLTQYFQAFVIS